MLHISHKHGFVDGKHVQRGPRYKKSRCPWDGIYQRTSIMFQTGGKPSTWFPPGGLVEQSTDEKQNNKDEDEDEDGDGDRDRDGDGDGDGDRHGGDQDEDQRRR